MDIGKREWGVGFFQHPFFVVIVAHLLPLTKLSNKATLALHSFSKCSFTLSKLRFFELRAPKISSCYTTSRLLVTGFAHRLEFSRALYLHYSNNKTGREVVNRVSLPTKRGPPFRGQPSLAPLLETPNKN